MVDILAFGHPLGPHLDLGLDEVLGQDVRIDPDELPDGGGDSLRLDDRLVVLGALLLELHLPQVHHCRHQLVDVSLLDLGEAKDVESFVHKSHVLFVVDGVHGDLPLNEDSEEDDTLEDGDNLADEVVVPHVVTEAAVLLDGTDLIGPGQDDHTDVDNPDSHDVVEDVVAALYGLLVGDPGLFEEVNLHGREVGQAVLEGCRHLPPCRPRTPSQTG